MTDGARHPVERMDDRESTLAPGLSVVIPVYNNAAGLGDLVARALDAAARGIGPRTGVCERELALHAALRRLLARGIDGYVATRRLLRLVLECVPLTLERWLPQLLPLPSP